MGKPVYSPKTLGFDPLGTDQLDFGLFPLRRGPVSPAPAKTSCPSDTDFKWARLFRCLLHHRTRGRERTIDQSSAQRTEPESALKVTLLLKQGNFQLVLRELISAMERRQLMFTILFLFQIRTLLQLSLT